MARSTLSGPLRVGPDPDTATPNTGLAVLSQTGTYTQNSTTAVDLIFYLPANAQILFFLIDSLVAYNSGTSATLSAGTASAGTQYISGVDMKATAGRLAPTYTAAQLTAMANITTNTTVYVTITVSGATSAGNGRVTMVYVQK